MKRRMHEHLRGGLAFGELYADTDDLLEPLPDNYEDDNEREVKRQRLEKIANDYLRLGRAPILLSTRLKGPFDGAWANPWVQSSVEQETDQAMEIPESCESPIVARSECRIKRGGRNGRSGSRIAVAHEPPREDDEPIRDHAKKERKSPRTGRSTKCGRVHFERRETSERRRATLAQDEANEGEQSQPADLSICSAQTGRRISLNKWLKRRKEDRIEEIHMDSPVQYTPHETPTRPTHDEEYFTLPNGHTPARSPSGYPKAPVLETQWQSSASAPMAISSPVQVQRTPYIGHGASCAMQGPDSMDTYTAEEFCRQPDSILQPTSTPSLHTQTPGVHLESSVLRLYEHTPMGLDSAKRSGRLSETQITYREQIQRSAERCANLSKLSNPPSKKRRSSRRTSTKAKEDLQDSPSVPRPQDVPTSFSGSFTYRKVGTRRTAKGGPKPAPRPVNFDSSPAVLKNIVGPEKETPAEFQPPSDKDNGEPPEIPAPPQEEDVGDESNMIEAPRGEGRRESGSSRPSMYSTQAAMMLAHLEFQDGTFPSTYASSGAHTQTPRPAIAFPGPLNDTPVTAMRQPSPIITAFSAFNAELDKKHPDTIRSPAMPISTQDLFMAASPFAISTIKKTKSTAPTKGSSLRFAVLSYTDAQNKHTNDDTVRSPTPSAERIPLKQRNSLMSFKSPYEKGTQKSVLSSQESTLSPQFGEPVTELPLLSFATSLDGELNFADQFLRNLDGLG